MYVSEKNFKKDTSPEKSIAIHVAMSKLMNRKYTSLNDVYDMSSASTVGRNCSKPASFIHNEVNWNWFREAVIYFCVKQLALQMVYTRKMMMTMFVLFQDISAQWRWRGDKTSR